MQTNVSVTADPAAETTMKKRNTLTIGDQLRSEEHTSELSHRCISYAVFCLKKKKKKKQ